MFEMKCDGKKRHENNCAANYRKGEGVVLFGLRELNRSDANNQVGPNYDFFVHTPVRKNKRNKLK